MRVAKLLHLMLLEFNERVLHANREMIATRLFWLRARVSLLSPNVGFFVVFKARSRSPKNTSLHGVSLTVNIAFLMEGLVLRDPETYK